MSERGGTQATQAASRLGGEDGVPRCFGCGEVIGAYEPTITLVGDTPVRTSRAALGAEHALRKACFHEDCFPGG